MNRLFLDLPGVFVYVDDLLIASRSKDEHLRLLKEVLRRLNKVGLRLKLSKCNFLQEQIQFLGHRVSAKGVEPAQDRVQTLLDWPLPELAEDLSKFLGLLAFYGRFIHRFAHRAALLYDMLPRGPGGRLQKTHKLEWSEQSKAAFFDLRQALASRILLAHPIPGAPMRIISDASNRAAGAVLEQLQPQERGESKWVPLACYSKKFSERQSGYSTFERELLAMMLAVIKFRPLIAIAHRSLWKKWGNVAATR